MNDDWDPESEEPIEIPIEDTIDLHQFRPKEIRDVVREYLDAAREASSACGLRGASMTCARLPRAWPPSLRQANFPKPGTATIPA